MQSQGIARPAPQQLQPQQPQQPQTPATPQSANDTLTQQVQNALQNPSAYGAPQVQQTFDMLNQQLGQNYDYQRKQLNDEMASRGLSESTIAGQRYSDLGTEQARAQANMATQLATQAAQTYGQDRTSALNAGLNLGNLGVSQGGLTGSYNGQQTLAAQLGLGNLGLGQQQLALQSQLGLGNLGVSQQQANTQQAGTLGNLQLGQQQLSQAGSQFGQTLAQQQNQFTQQQQLAQLQNAQQYGLNAGQLTGSFNGQQTLGAQQISTQNNQFQQSLMQALGMAQMQDKTANRGIDVQSQTNSLQNLLQLLAAVPGLSGAGLAGLYGGSGGSGGSSGSGAGATGGAPAGGSNGTAQGSNGTGSQGGLQQYTPAQMQMIDYLSGAQGQALRLSNPALYAQEWMMAVPQANMDGTMPDGGKNTVNFNGQQYTPSQYYQMMAQHPELFKVSNDADASNQKFFTQAATDWQNFSNQRNADATGMTSYPTLQNGQIVMQYGPAPASSTPSNPTANQAPSYAGDQSAASTLGLSLPTLGGVPSKLDAATYDRFGQVLTPQLQQASQAWHSAMDQFNNTHDYTAYANDASAADQSTWANDSGPTVMDEASWDEANGAPPLKFSSWLKQQYPTLFQ